MASLNHNTCPQCPMNSGNAMNAEHFCRLFLTFSYTLCGEKVGEN